MNSFYLWQALAMPGPSLIPDGRSLKHVRLTRARLAGIRDQNLPPVGLVHSVLNCIIDMGIAGLHRGRTGLVWLSARNICRESLLKCLYCRPVVQQMFPDLTFR